MKDTSASFTVSRPPTLNAGLVGYWTFDGADTNFTTNTVTDRSGNGNIGTMVNMSTSTAPPSKIGQALQFDGVNDYVTTANKDYFSPSVNNLIVSVLVKIPTDASPIDSGACGASGSIILSKATGSNWEFAFENDNNNRICVDWWRFDGSGLYGVVSIAQTMNDNKWHNYTGVFTSTGLTLYVDGSQANQNTIFSGTINNGTQPLEIGRRGDVNY